MLRFDGSESLSVEGVRYVPFSEDVLSGKFPKGKSKARMIVDYLEEHQSKAFYSLDVWEALESEGVTKPDIMSTVRRYEKKGNVFVRGYRSDRNQTPFARGFILT